MKFTRKKPTKAGRYMWRLKESSKSGHYTINVIIETSEGALRVFSNGTEVATLHTARGGMWCDGHAVAE